MALRAVYEQFLVEPTTAVLADDASLSYVTTLVTVNDATAILKHVAAQNRHLKRKGDKVLSAIESSSSLCLEVETTLQFLTGGGAFLPGLDDNFLADRTVSFPTVHIVHFDASRKIQRIRLHWDQGSLLRQVDVIGARSKNWPIRNGMEQLRLIASGAAASADPPSAVSSRPTTASRDDGSSRGRAASQRSSVAGLHEILSPPQRDREAFPNFSPVRESTRPPTRDLKGILAGSDAEDEHPRSPSPKRKNTAKSGAGKNFRANRLFDEEEQHIPEPSPERKLSNARRYNHFELGGGEEVAHPRLPSGLAKTANKHTSQWDFADFATPEKVAQKIRSQDVRHINWDNDDDALVSPVKRPVVHHERPDAKAHFEMTDDSTPVARKTQPTRGGGHNKGLGLYTSSIRDDGDDIPKAGPKGALNDLSTNPNVQNRHKDFDSSWEMTDKSPTLTKDAKAAMVAMNGKHVAEDRRGTQQGVDAHWDMYDESPGRKENVPTGINIQGNGMGGRKDTTRHWGFGDDSDEEVTHVAGKTRGPPQPQSNGLWDF